MDQRPLDDELADLIDETLRRIEPRPCLRCREREPGRLQLRIVLHTDIDEHVDAVGVREVDDRVIVLATVCTSSTAFGREALDVPVHVYLERPLGDRVVIDATTGQSVERFSLLACER